MTRSIARGVTVAWLAAAALGGTATADVLEVRDPAKIQTVSTRTAPPTVDEARALQGQERWEDAAEAWAEIADANPGNGGAWFNLGYCLHAAGRLDEAMKIHRKAASFDDFRGIALYNLGCALALKGENDAALEVLQASQAAGFDVAGSAFGDSDLKSLHDDPRLAAMLGQGRGGQRGGGGGGMQSWLQQVAGGVQGWMHENVPQFEEQVAGMMQQAAGQIQAMIMELQNQLKAEIAKLLDDPEMAQMIEELSQDPQMAEVLHMVEGWLGQPIGDGGGDNPVARSGNSSLDEALATARHYQNEGEWEKAVAAYGSVLEHDPENAPATFGYAYCLHMSGDYEHAIWAHKKAAMIKQFEGISMYNLACAYALTGEKDKAFEALVASWEAGFDVAGNMAGDADLKSLRDDPRFKRIHSDASARLRSEI